MRSPTIILVAGLVPFLVAAQAPSVEPAAAPKSASGVARLSEVVCKKFPPALGTRIGARKICKTRAEWDFIRDQEQEVLEHALRKPFDGR